MNTRNYLARITAAFALVSAVTLSAFTLKNSKAQWLFADNGALTHINSQQLTSGWQLMLRAPGSRFDTLSSHQVPAPTVSAENGKAVITWQDIPLPRTAATVTIQQTIALRDDGAAVWETAVKGLPEQFQWDIASPLISLSEPQTPSVLAIPEQTGRLYLLPFELNRLELAYPSQATMQFMAFTTADSGLLLYAQDPLWLSKKLIAEAHNAVLTIAIAQTAAEGKTSPVVLQPFTGDATAAARLYGDWAIRHIKTTPVPSWLTQTPFFAVTNHEPALAVNQWLNLRELTETPFTAIYRNYTIAHHNENAPECFPTDSYFNSATHIAPAMDCSLAPMVPSRLWAREQTTDAVHTADGLPLINRKTNGKAITTLCPATRAWQDKLLENARRLVVDHGCKAIAIEDLLTADIDCTCEQHRHAKRVFPAVNAVAEALDRIKADLSADMPDVALIATGLHEGLIGHVDATIVTSPAFSENSTAAPLFQAAYGSRTVIAGTSLSFQDQREQAIRKLSEAFAAGTRFMTEDFGGRLDPAEPLPQLIRDAAQIQSYFNVMPNGRPLPCQLITTQQNHDDSLPRLLCGTPDSIRAVAVANANTLLFACFNLSAIPQHLTLAVPEKLLPAQCTAMQFPHTPLDNPAQTDFTLNPYSITAIRISNTPLPSHIRPLSKDLQVLFAGDDEYFPLCTGETAQELWACDDAFVARNPVRQYGMFQPLNKFKSIGIRKSALNEEFPKGNKAIGNPLPRHHDDQPFGIIRKLPHTLAANAIVYTLFGDDSCVALNGAIPKGAVFSTPKPGVFAARIVTNGGDAKGTFQFFSTLQQLNEALAKDDVKLIVSIAYTALDASTLKQAQEFAASHHLDMTDFTAAWNTFAQHPDMARLAALSHASQELFKQANRCQHFFAVGAPGWNLLRQAQACVKAATIFADCMNSPCLAPEHDWLIPGIPKPVLTFFVNKSPQNLINATTLIPLGLSNPKAFSYTTIENTESDQYPGFELLLKDDSACHSLITLSAWTAVPVENEQLLAMDMTWLTVNQPLYPFYFPYAPFIGPNKTTSLQFGLLNNTPFKLDVTIAPETPAGWIITPEPQLLTLDSWDFNKISLVIQGGEKLSEGLGSINVNPLLSDAPHSDPKAVIPVDTINPPVLAGTRTGLDSNQTLTAQSFALYAIFAKKNERIVINVKNIGSEFAVWNLYNPNFEDVRNGKLKKDESSKITLTAVRDAAYLLKIIATDAGDIEITSSSHALSLRASAAHPHIYTTDAPAQHAFFVPQDATHVICQADNQNDSTDITITAPDKQVYTLRDNAPVRIPVSQDNTAKPWLLSAKNAKGTAIRLSGDAVPWLAPSPETVLSFQ